MHSTTLDDFADPGAWMPIASGQAELTLTGDQAPDGAPALRLGFDFRGGGGFVVARRPLSFTLPESYALRLRLRGDALPNKLEVKLVDQGGANVWRWQQEPFDFSGDWRSLTIKGSQIEFAWGPAGGGAPRDIGAIEVAVVAGPGGSGRLWLADLALEDRRPREPAVIRASSARPGCGAGSVLARGPDDAWRPEPDDAAPWLEIDFPEPRELGGLTLRWAQPPGDLPARHGFAVQASDDGAAWRDLYAAPTAAGPLSYVYLPGTETRYLRLTLSDAQAAGVAALEVQPFDFSRDRDGFFHAIAADAPRGRYPKWLYREQTYWTPVDIPDGRVPALLNEEGMLEPYRGGWSLEPFLWLDGTLVTWAEAAITQGLERGDLPIPSVRWAWGGLTLTVTVCAAGEPEAAVAYARYRVEGPGARRVRLYLALRPFQVSPPWQRFGDLGGVARVAEVAWRDGALWVNGRAAVTPLCPPAGFGAAGFDQGPITDYLARGSLPVGQSVSDPFGHASAALAFDLDVSRTGTGEVWLAIPLDPDQQIPAAFTPGPQALDAALTGWADLLAGVRFDLPGPGRDYARTCRSAAAQILINRDGPALQPGPRRYTRSWIRDGAGMAAALLRLGLSEPVRDFLRWYAPFQAADGNVPCCVDATGPDWLPEHDSHGQLVFALAEYHRFSGDLDLARELWPACLGALGYLEDLRAQRLTPEYRAAERRACFGLLPESVSHEGYLAHPVHSYWDDFWALRGLKDAVYLAGVLGETGERVRLSALRDSFAASLHASLACTMAGRGIDFLPGSVEWADADATAVANALTLADETHRLPPAALTRTFDLFLERFRAMRSGAVPWVNYTPYEIRILGALVRLGRRSEAHELARFFLAERRPQAWNQWPEIAWRDPRTPGHQGDLPHTWIAAEYILAFRDWFAYEREADQALVIAAGIPPDWLAAGPVAVTGLPTWYGRLDLRLDLRADGALDITLGGDLRLPPGGLWLAPPLAGPPRRVLADGRPLTGFTQAGGRLSGLPGSVRLVC